jgi:maleate isomerase
MLMKPAARAIATITPSGNRVVEPVTQTLCAAAGVDSLFSRIPVHGDAGGATDYDWERMLEAATLLSHAKPDAICWNGTKGGALGFDIDRRLTARITAATGCPATTSALSILEALAGLGARSIALVTPYDDAYQAKCIAGYRQAGVAVAAERHSGLTDNLSYAFIGEAEIGAMTRAALAEARCDAVVYFCTNLAGAPVVPALEAELGVPILDSTTLGVWGALRAAGVDTAPLTRFGRVFALR